MTEIFEYIDFGVQPKSKMPISKNEARVVYIPKGDDNKQSSYYIAFSTETSKAITEQELFFMRTRINTLTGDIYVIFQHTPTNDSIRVNANKKNNPSVRVSRRMFVEYIINKLHVDMQDGVGNIHVSDNKSQKPNMIVLQLTKKEQQ